MIHKPKARVVSIDLLRGVVMILMALDHVRDYFHYDAFFYAPTDLSQTNAALFFTRFITHFCAPVFMFLAGTSAFFVGRRLTKKQLSTWLLKRGLWLIFLEFTVIKIAWYFQPNYELIEFMVIWALGVCMIILAGMIHLPRKWVIGICLIGIFGHNLTDGVSFETTWLNNLWIFFHRFDVMFFGNIEVFIAYPIVPWMCVMPLGYYFGALYTGDFSIEKRKDILLRGGVLMITLFVALRAFNVYGDPNPWQSMDTLLFTIMSFFNVQKYPPSLLYLLITLGPALIFLSLAESWKGKFLDKIVIIGRVPMFYYLIHLFVIHGLAVIAAVLTSHNWSDMILDRWITEVPVLKGYGFSLPIVYLVWLAVVIILYPICSKFYTYKAANKDKWWLSYL